MCNHCQFYIYYVKKSIHRGKNGLLVCKQDMVLNYSMVTTLLRTAEENLLLVAPSAFTTR